MMRQLLDIVNQTEELPLRIHLCFPAQRKAVQPLVVSKVSEYWLDYCKAPAVAYPSLGRIEAFLHSLCVTLGRARGLALEEGDLPRFGLLGRA